jgi:hypothetical protein
MLLHLTSLWRHKSAAIYENISAMVGKTEPTSIHGDIKMGEI